jgi:hypothetical protein
MLTWKWVTILNEVNCRILGLLFRSTGSGHANGIVKFEPRKLQNFRWFAFYPELVTFCLNFRKYTI